MEYHLTEENKFLPAYCEAQAKLIPVVRATWNEFTNKPYADLSDILTAELKAILTECRLVLIQTMDTSMLEESDTPRITVSTRLYHADSQEYVVTGGTLGGTKLSGANATQMLYATGTYMKRNQVAAILGIASKAEDTDGATESVDEDPGSEDPSEGGPAEGPAKGAKKDPKRQAVIDEIGEVATSELFTDADRAEFRRSVAAAKTIPDLNVVLEDAKAALRIKEQKAGMGEDVPPGTGEDEGQENLI